MTINTNTLLNMLAPKLTETTKSTIETSSKEGKTNITNLLKDANVKTLLNGLFQDLAVGDKSKATVSQLLQNNKQMFDLKTLSSDIKNIVKHTQTDPKMEKQTTILKQFQMDIKAVDEKAIKSSISNSGIFLESKLANKPTTSVLPYNVKVAIKQIQEIENQVSNSVKEIKTIIKNILSPTVSSEQPKAQLDTKNQNLATNITKAIANLKELITNTPQDTKAQATSIKNLLTQTTQNPKLEVQNLVLKDAMKQLDNLPTTKPPLASTNIVKNSILSSIKPALTEITKIQTQAEIKTVATNIKETIKNPQVDTKVLSTNVKSLATLVQSQPKQVIVLKDIATKLDNMPQAKTNVLETLKVQVDTILKAPEQIKNPVAEIKTLTTQLKALTTLIQSNPNLATQTANLKDITVKLTALNETPNNTNIQLNSKMKLVESLKQPIETVSKTAEQIKIKAQAINTSDIKNNNTELKTTITQIQTNPKLDKQTAVLKEYLANSTTQQPKIQAGQNIQNSLPKIQADIKATLLQVQEYIDTKSVDAPKEIKAQVDKVLGQIEFYQLSSYANQSNHTSLPFDWDDIEDATVEFKSNTKENFSCHIGLSLKNYGEINAMLVLDLKNNININISVQQESLKTKIQGKLQVLRQGINKIGLNLQSLNILDIQDPTKQTYEEKAYGKNSGLNFGLDVKA